MIQRKISKRSPFESGCPEAFVGSKFETLTGGEIHGRGGESLPSHEKSIVGSDAEWERECDERAETTPLSGRIERCPDGR
jgi:hypothetical protein